MGFPNLTEKTRTHIEEVVQNNSERTSGVEIYHLIEFEYECVMNSSCEGSGSTLSWI